MYLKGKSGHVKTIFRPPIFNPNFLGLIFIQREGYFTVKPQSEQKKEGGIIIKREKICFMSCFRVFKAIKENVLSGVGHPNPLWTPSPLRLSQKPRFVVFVKLHSNLQTQLNFSWLE